MSYRELYAEAMQREARRAIERVVMCQAYAETRARLVHMLNFDHDLEVVAKKSPTERLETLLNSIKDFNTFLENYVAQGAADAKRDYENS